jgi:NitT/TauT family transport system substrate-binding protein
MRRAPAFVGLLISAFALSACGQSGAALDASGDGPIKIRYGVAAAAPGPDQSPYTSLPRALGYWEDEGLDVEVLGFAGSGATFQALAAGKIDVGQGPPDPLFAAVASGNDLTAFYDHVPGNFLMPEVPEGSSIDGAEDMKGATVGVASLEAGGVTLVKAMAAKAGLQPSDYDIVAIGTGAEAKQYITKGDVDVVALWDSAYTALGLPLTPITDEYFDSIGFNNAIATTTENLEKYHDAMVGIARGVAKATLFAHENPEAAVKIHWKLYPESKPVGVPEDEALAQAVAVLESRNANTEAPEEGWGYSTEKTVQDHMQMLLDAGVLPKPVPADQLWNGDLIAEINDFDADEVREEARTWKE